MSKPSDNEKMFGKGDVGNALAPFRHAAFTIVWTATVVSNIGSWMYNAASGWLMTSLDPAPPIVSLVQVASALPMFLFALPAGALADIVDKRRFLIVAESSITLVSAIFALLVWLEDITPFWLLFFTFLAGVGGALAAPAWQTVVPQLVPRRDLAPAVALNSVGVNVSRAIGPALGGIIIGSWGIAAPFWLNAVSNLGVIGALIWWHPAKPANGALPAERFMSAMRIGIRHARFNTQLRASIFRAIGFFLFASSYWALLPLVARDLLAGGPSLYGILLGAIGAGAVGGAFLLPKFKAAFGADRLVVVGTFGTAATLIIFALTQNSAIAIGASSLAGASWIAVLSSLNVAAQLALPDWVRGRGLAVYVTVFFGAMTLGSVVWGEAAGWVGVRNALLAAAAGTIIAVPATRRWKIASGSGLDLSPSLHWATPIVTQDVEADQGPVLVSIEYRIAQTDREAFLTALRELQQQRRRDGAYDWDVFEDISENGRYVEMFWVDSWLEHLRQHQRVTNADRLIQERAEGFQTEGSPRVTHMLGVRRG